MSLLPPDGLPRRVAEVVLALLETHDAIPWHRAGCAVINRYDAPNTDWLGTLQALIQALDLDPALVRQSGGRWAPGPRARELRPRLEEWRARAGETSVNRAELTVLTRSGGSSPGRERPR